MSLLRTRRRGPATTVAVVSLAGGLALSGVAVAGMGTAAHASTAPSSYTATSASNAFFLVIQNSAIPLLSAIEGGGPSAQSELDSVQQSNSFAAFPYPGEEEVGVPGLVGSILGLPVPSYPAYISTSDGQEPVHKTLPGIVLNSSVDNSSSSASATAGDQGTVNAAASASAHLASDGTVSASSNTHFRAIDVGGVLQVSGLESSASASRGPTGTLTRKSNLSFGDISVPGLNLTLPSTLDLCPINQLPISGIPPIPCPKGVTAIPLPKQLAGTTIATPHLGFDNGKFVLSLPTLGNKSYAIPTSIVSAAFKAVGITFTYQKPKKLKDGIIASGLVLTQKLPKVPGNLPIPVVGTPGPTTITYTFGESSATVQASAYDTTPGGGSVVSSPGGGNTGITSGGTTGPAGTIGGSEPGGSIPSVPGVTSPGVGSAPSVATSGGAALSAYRSARTSNGADIYLAIVGAALLAFGATQLIRVAGVRKLWAS